MVATAQPAYTPISTDEPSDRRALDALYEIAKILSASADPSRMLCQTLNILDTFLDLRCGAVALLADPETGPVAPSRQVNPYTIAATCAGVGDEAARLGAMPPVVAESVLRTGVATMIQDVVGELGPDVVPDALAADGEPVALLAAPIHERGTTPLVTGVVSVLRVLDANGGHALDQDLRLLSMVANLMAQAIRFRRTVARDRRRLMEQAEQATERVRDARPELRDGKVSIIGESAGIRAVIDKIRKVAPSKSTVLLRGESGTGKELFARAVHRLSDRAQKPFIKVNCAALSENLLESELFGHEKGSFTGAMTQKKGRFELADGGTLFLDEIGEISANFQAKLLRALQEGEFERVGGSKTIKVDVRLVAATNKDLEEAVAKGDFRADLYFRICVIPIVLPPLRERPGDIAHLAQAFLDRFNQENQSAIQFGDGALDILSACAFPGNVRELENCVNRVATLVAGDAIRAEDLACQQDACLSAQLWRLQTLDKAPIGGLGASKMVLPVIQPSPAAPANCPGRPPEAGRMSERDELIDAMEKSGWVQAKAARMLGLTPRQIGYALKKHNIEIKRL